jgi:phage baseplate assembly protein W
MKKITGTYCDLDINFDRNPVSNDVVTRRDEEAIKRSLRNLILLRKNEKPFHPEIYSGVTDMLFELSDSVSIFELKSRVADIIKNHESRVQDIIVDLRNNIDRNEINLTIHFTIKNIQKVYTTTMLVKRTR